MSSPAIPLMRQSDTVQPPEEAPPPKAAKPGRVVVLDGLRLFAALMVVSYHYLAYDRGGSQPWDADADQVWPHAYLPASYGLLGVQVFFVISGFVICMSGWGRTLAGFFRSRVTRLYPAYWVAVLLTFTVLSLFPIVRRPVDLNEMLLNLTMLHEPMNAQSVDAVYWTLWVEARFYLLFALLVWKGLTAQRVTLFCYVWLIAAAVTEGAGVPLLTTIVMPDYAPYFVAGMAFYLIYKYGSHPLTWALVAVSFLMAQKYTVDLISHTANDVLERPLPIGPGVIIVAVCFVVMALIATHKFDRITWRWLTVAGALTYPLYLVHEYIGWTIINASYPYAPKLVVLLGTVAAMMILAWLVHRLVERPVGKLLNRALKRPLPKVPA